MLLLLLPGFRGDFEMGATWHGNHSSTLPAGRPRKQTIANKTHLVLPMNHALKVNCCNFNMLRIDGGGAKILLLTLSVRIPLYKEAW